MSTETTAPATPAAPERAETDTVSFSVAADRLGEIQSPRKAQLHEPRAEPADAAGHRRAGVSQRRGRAGSERRGHAWSAGMDLKEYFREIESKGLRAVRQAQREAYGWWRRLR